MADEIIDPTAQGQVQADPGTNQQADVVEQSEDAKFKVGVQKRIDELTARFHQERESSSKKDEHILALTRQIMEQSNQRQAPVAEPQIEVPEGMDPAQAAYFNQMFGKLQQQFQQQLTHVSALAQRGEAAQAAAAQAAQFGIVDPSKVAWLQGRAAELAANWKKQGYQFAPSDAADFATMELLKQNGGLPKPAGNGHFMPATHANPGNPPPNLSPQTQRPALPNNFNSLRPEDQIRILEKRGADDVPF